MTPSTATPALRRALARTRRVLALGVLAVVAFLVIGNLVIVGAWKWQSRAAAESGVQVAGVKNFEVVDAKVWRGAAPNEASYRDMAAQGVTTVVDLRAENDVTTDAELLDRLGLRLVSIPIRDGQAPTEDQVERFLDAVASSEGPVFVHCGAGVGRTGTMVAAYRVATGSSASEAVRANLAIGPPSLEQVAFAASLDGEVHRPNAAVVAASRLLDAPRRLWSRYGT